MALLLAGVARSSVEMVGMLGKPVTTHSLTLLGSMQAGASLGVWGVTGFEDKQRGVCERRE